MAVTAKDLWPLVEKMSPEERVRLARMALSVLAAGDVDAATYGHLPVKADEAGGDVDEPLAWDGEGWDGIG
jgi:hypothetical protein